MGFEWTSQQAQAIEKTGKSVFVSAAAGSGKTAVLTERIINQILNGADIDKYLIVTFTVAAAGEMRKRIIDAINKKLAGDPSNPALIRQSMLVHKAQITTISAFCLDLIKQNFHLLSLPPDFTIAEEITINILQKEICEKVIDKNYEENDENFCAFAQAFSERNDGMLSDIVLDFSKKLENMVDPKSFMEKIQDTKGDLFGSETDNIINKYIADELMYFISGYDYVLKRLLGDEVFNEFSQKLNIERTFLYESYVKLKENSENTDEILNALNGYEYDVLRSPKGYSEDDSVLLVKDIRDDLKKFTRNKIKRFLNYTNEDYRNTNNLLKPLISGLIKVYCEYKNELEAEKLKRKIVTFADIERYAYKLLIDENKQKTQFAKEICEKYDYIMVDEYQDTNEIQDSIFKAISKDENNLFLVGDLKQSIYKFRGSNLKIFLEKFNVAKNNKSAYPLTLSGNFRSSQGVIDFVNYVFSLIISPETGGVVYDEEQKLFCHAHYDVTDEVEFDIVLSENKPDDKNEEQEELSKTQLCARHIALKINDMVQKGYLVEEKGVKRPCRYSDFAILHLAPKNKTQIYMDEFKRLNIPVLAEQQDVFFESYEVMVMISFLSAIDNPYKDIELVSLMRSPVCMFTSNELADIRLYDKYGPYYNAVKKASENGNQKCADLIFMLEKYREYSLNMPVYELIWKIYSDTGLTEIISGLNNGKQRVENLNEFYRHAKNYEASSFKGLHNFIKFINQIIENGESFLGASDNIGENSVRFMSIHKSKGLEFPVCFIAETEQKFNFSDTNKSMLIDESVGIGTFIKDSELNIKYTTLQREAIIIKSINETISELLRVLYVALTRSKQKLIMVYTADEKRVTSNIKNNIWVFDNDNFSLQKKYIQKAQSFSDWLLLCAAVHPDSENLRKFAGVNEVSLRECGRLKVNIDEKFEDVETSSENKPETVEFSKEELEKSINNNYNMQLVNVPAKLAVSEFKGKQSFDEDAALLYEAKFDFKKPKFLQNEFSQAEKGTAIHHFMQFCDFNNLKTFGVESEITRLKEESFISQSESENIDVEKIKRFISSKLFDNIIRNEYYREHRFNILVEAKLLNKNDTSNEKLLIQGIIDCFYIENDKAVVIDYKTDRIKNELEFIDKYKLQLQMYKHAVEKLFKIEVSDCYIYSFYLDKEIKL